MIVWELGIRVGEREIDSDWIPEGNFKYWIQTKFPGKFEIITIIIDTLIKIVFRYVAYGGTAYMEICSKLTGLEIFCSVATDWNSSKRKFPFYYCTFNISTYLLVIRSLSSTRTSSSNLMIAESMFTTPSSTCLRFTCWLAWSTSSRITRTTKSKLENWWLMTFASLN